MSQDNQDQAPLVETPSGWVQGQRKGKLWAFCGIPYAQPPRRFLPPEPLHRWQGVRIADQYGPASIQSARPLPGQSESEDCLTLNIWTPAADGQLRPVLFYIHGGGFTSGSGAGPTTADSAFASEGGIVTVTVNYRLGVLGFLDVHALLGEDYRSSGNNGLMDLIEALRWVRSNISAFGGDPSRVTIMGQSAGAKCVGGLLHSPLAEGLFHQAIAMSGSVQSIRDRRTSAALARSFLEVLGLAPGEERKLPALPASRLIDAQHAWVQDMRGIHLFGPVIDGHVITAPPLAGPADRKLPLPALLIGTNRNEAAGFIAGNPIMRRPSRELLDRMYGLNAPAVEAEYRRRSGLTVNEPIDAAVWEDVLTDHMYRIAAIHTAEAWSRAGAPVWMYRFDRRNPSGKAQHAEEAPFVWNKYVPDGEQELATAVHHAWTSFIHTGSPQPALPEWPAYEQQSRRFLVLDEQRSVESLEPSDSRPQFPASALRLE